MRPGVREGAASADRWRSPHPDGPYLETKEHIGGFWILECADMDEAVAWARKGVAATRGQVEVREIFFNPSPD